MAQWSRALDAESAPCLYRGMNSERAGSMLRLRESLLKEVQDVLAKEGGSCQVRTLTLAHTVHTGSRWLHYQMLPTAVYAGTFFILGSII